jgi:ribonuclease P protein component
MASWPECPREVGGGSFRPDAPAGGVVWRSKGLPFPVPRYLALRGKACFDEVYQRGTRCDGKHVGLRARRNGLGVTRRGFAIGRKVGSAVVRNRIRRRLRAVLGKLAPEMGWDLVLTGRPSAATAPFGQLETELKTLLGAASVDLVGSAGG